MDGGGSLLIAGQTGVSAQGAPTLDALAARASRRLAQDRPALSAATGLTRGQAGVALAALAVTACVALLAPRLAMLAAHGLAQALFALLIALRLAALCAPRPAAPKSAASRTASPREAAPLYSILVALYREAPVAAQLIGALDRLDWPADRREVLLLIEADDEETRSALAALVLPRGFRVIVAPAHGPRTKPKALNIGLVLARGAYVAIYDAEDRPHPDQLKAAHAAFTRGGAELACVQAPLAIHDPRGHWIARQFALEYAIHFRVLIPMVSALGWPVPLGGTSNHFRRAALLACGGWDPWNVTEDADLGVRLARDRWRVAMIDRPTYEEAPGGLSVWIRQRTRWIKGHLQTWAVHMRRPDRLAADVGLWGALGLQATLLATLISAFSHGPLLAGAIAALWLGLLQPLDFALLLGGYVSAGLCAGLALARERALSTAGAMIAVLTLPLYWPLQTIAAARAAWQLWRSPFVWEKTPHGDPGPAWVGKKRQTA
jgi:cellulose synthase/poly-beta-1,6-N-acetylglucosamine synthase-like glycosyltransferase